ncbi:MAG: adenylate/guanylate cyclase domain-containing protein [Crocinitomicaceae bacterium]|nr:adenylate/guanylate cyclase domain-containing protein [Crocinitomicaceae bacterium]
MERFINILIIESDAKTRVGLKEMLSGSGNNVLLADSMESATDILEKKEIGIVLVDVEESKSVVEELKEFQKSHDFKNQYIILIANESASSKLVKGIKQGAVDYISTPFNPNLIRSKIEVYKSLFYKDQRIAQLLSNIFPDAILADLSRGGKFSPKRVQNGVVLFTDFVDFSSKAKNINPLGLIKRLEYYFTKFDSIVDKYNLEKIKTIGDAYMALSGVTEGMPRPAIRACLAALEIRDFMRNERDIAIAMRKDFWEIRIGLHMGPLVAGIIGSSKFSFDVWGDTVNIASRAEEVTKSGNITITSNIADGIGTYFETTPRGKIDIHKRGGSIEMFYLKKLKNQHSMDGSGLYPSAKLRTVCGLASMDFDQLRENIITRLRSLLPETVVYHDVPHTLNVEIAATRYATLEGVDPESILLLRTATLFHDAGYIYSNKNNEDFGINMAKSMLPNFGYSGIQIEIIEKIINSTKHSVEPTNLMEMIMCDADHDYLGRPDYYAIANKLRQEYENEGRIMTDKEWIEFQLHFLENTHEFYTQTAKNIRNIGKTARIRELNIKLKQLEESEK